MTGPSALLTTDPAATDADGARAAHRWLVPAALCLAGFLAITVVVVLTGRTDGFDSSVYRDAISLRSADLTRLAHLVTTLGAFPVVVIIALLVAALLRRSTGQWRSSMLLLGSVVITAGIVYLSKIAVGRGRPTTTTLLGTPSADGAFPSGHTTDGSLVLMLSALLLGFALRRRWLRRALLVAAVSLALGIGVTRVYLGYHWATDVIAGWLLAGSICCAAGFVAALVEGGVRSDDDQRRLPPATEPEALRP